MKTFIIKWNPELSSLSLKDFKGAFRKAQRDDTLMEATWNLCDHEKAKEGHRFLLLRVGDKSCGVVASGYLASPPYLDAYHKETGKPSYYCYVKLDAILHPTKVKPLSTDLLQQCMPKVEWNEGESGILLPSKYESVIENLWESYLQQLSASEQQPFCKVLSCSLEECIAEACYAHEGQHDLDGKPAIMHPLAVACAASNEQEMITAVLHDVAEDCKKYSVNHLRYMLSLPYSIYVALQLLTHKKEKVSYSDYIKSIIQSENELAIKVKIFDLLNNIQRGIMGGHSKQVEKHLGALQLFAEAVPHLVPNIDDMVNPKQA